MKEQPANKDAQDQGYADNYYFMFHFCFYLLEIH
jgi:hypothetical protein